MPGPAADVEQTPFCDAEEELPVRASGDGNGNGDNHGLEKPQARGQRRQQQDIVWRNVFLMSLLHLGALYSLLLIPKAKPLTLLWSKSRAHPLHLRLCCSREPRVLWASRDPPAGRSRSLGSGVMALTFVLPGAGRRPETAQWPAPVGVRRVLESCGAPLRAPRRAQGAARQRRNRVLGEGSAVVASRFLQPPPRATDLRTSKGRGWVGYG